MKRFGWLALVGGLLALAGCPAARPGPTLRIVLGKAPPLKTRYQRPQRSGPALEDMDCYFATISPTEGEAGVPSCMGLGRSSRPLALAALRTDGIAVRAPVGFGRRLRVYGVSGASNCSARPSVVSLFVNQSRPAVYLLGEATVDVVGDAEVTVEPSYVAASAENLSSCDSSTLGLVVDGFSPSGGIRRGGGATLTLSGKGFESGATVAIGGQPCTNPSITSTAIQCTLPILSPGSHAVTVQQGGSSVSAENAYQAQSLIMVARDDADSYIASIWMNPETGEGGAKSEAATGLGTTVDFQELAVHRRGHVLYAAQSGPGLGGISRWSVDPVTGAVGYLDLVSVPGDGVYFLGMDEKNGLLYAGVRNSSNTTLFIYSVNEVTGVLTLLNGAGTGLSGVPLAMTYSPATDLLYTRTSASTSVFSHEWDEVTLAARGSTAGVPSGSLMAADSSFPRLYVTNLDGPKTFQSWKLDEDSVGDFDLLDIQAGGPSTVKRVVFNASVSRFYALEVSQGTVVHFEIDPSDGEIDGGPFNVPITVDTMTGLALDARNRFLVAVEQNNSAGEVRVIPLDSEGTPSVIDTLYIDYQQFIRNVLIN